MNRQKYQLFLYADAYAEVKAVGLLGSIYGAYQGNQISGPIEIDKKIKGRLVDP